MDDLNTYQSAPDKLAIGEAVKLTIATETYKVRREIEGYCTCVPATCSFIWFNETGFLILLGIAKQKSRSKLVEDMNKRFPLSQSYWLSAVDDFITYLIENHILPESFSQEVPSVL